MGDFKGINDVSHLQEMLHKKETENKDIKDELEKVGIMFVLGVDIELSVLESVTLITFDIQISSHTMVTRDTCPFHVLIENAYIFRIFKPASICTYSICTYS
jgi:hypothetical protein